MFSGYSDYYHAMFCCLNCAQQFDCHAFSTGQKLGGAAEHLIDHSEKHICRLSFDLKFVPDFKRKQTACSVVKKDFFLHFYTIPTETVISNCTTTCPVLPFILTKLPTF